MIYFYDPVPDYHSFDFTINPDWNYLAYFIPQKHNLQESDSVMRKWFPKGEYDNLKNSTDRTVRYWDFNKH